MNTIQRLSPEQREEVQSMIQITLHHKNEVDKEALASLKEYTKMGFEAVNKRFEEMLYYMEKRFEAQDKRFEDMKHYTDKRFEDIMTYMDKRFNQLFWTIGIGFSTITALCGAAAYYLSQLS